MSIVFKTLGQKLGLCQTGKCEAESFQWILSFGIFLFIVGYYVLFSNRVYGPFIFSDETVYFQQIFDFALGKPFMASQYGPFFSWLASRFVDPGDIITSYHSVRILNVVVFSFGFFPLYFLLRSFRFEASLSFLWALFLMLRPWGSITSVIWGDPLLYLLYSVSFLFVFRYLLRPRPGLMFFIGIVFGALSLTKQAGFLLAASFFLIVLFYNFRKITLRERLVAAFPGLISFSMIFLSYVLYSRSTTGSSIGYSNVVNAMIHNILALLLNADFYKGFSYQLSHLVAAQFFIVPLGIPFFLCDWKSRDGAQRSLFLILSCVTLLMAVFISAFNNSMVLAYNSPNIPDLANGRYLTPLVPLWIIFGLSGWFKFFESSGSKWALLVGSVASILVLCGLASPFRSVWSHGIVNAPDTMYLLSLLERTGELPEFPWGQAHAHQLDALFTGRLLVWAVLLLAVFWIVGRFSRSRLALVIFVGSLGVFSSYQSLNWVNFLSSHTDSANLLMQAMQKEKLPIERVKIEADTVPDYILNFWYPDKRLNVQEQGQIKDDLFLLTIKATAPGYEPLFVSSRLHLLKKVQ